MNNLPDQQFHPDRPVRRPLADVYSRRELQRRAPQVEELYAEVIAHIERTGHIVPSCLGQVVNSGCVRSLLEPHWQRAEINPALVSPRTVIFQLPDEFEPRLASFVAQGPEVFNHPNTTLRSNTTYMGWTVRLPGNSAPSEIWVHDIALHEAMSAAWRYQEREWGWVPVIALAGDAIATCGFEVDETFVCSAQAARMSASDSIPGDVQTEKRLDVAATLAAEVGLTPWFKAGWEATDWDSERRFVLGATVYNRNDADWREEHSPAG